MTSTMAAPASPWKFLDAYTSADAAIFFGRDRETRVLVNDVIVNRLVVLFARTGTGKTSLINAGARPRLEAQGFATFFIRVHEDPVLSAQAELRTLPSLRDLADGSFAEQLKWVVEKLGQPVVLFFDQFEEFFIYVQKPNPARARKFIEDVARIYRDPDSGVHFVFSMREEFFVEMDVFRDQIPAIFHNESNLRLRRFDRQEALEAIVHPARVFDVRLDSDLVEQLLTDLAAAAGAGGTIEPAQLQIVCDALWEKREEGRLTLAHYRSLGQAGARENIAQQVLYSGLQKAFSRVESKEKLDLLDRLLAELRTEHGTKWVREVGSLAQVLTSGRTDVGPKDVDEILRLLEGARFIRRTRRDSLEVVELSHDYLVDRIDELRRRVRLIWPQSLVDAATPEMPMPRSELNLIAESLDSLTIPPSTAAQLFFMALTQSAQPERWFLYAGAAGVDTFGMLTAMLVHEEVRGLMSPLVIGLVESLLQNDHVPAMRGELWKILDQAVLQEATTVEAQESLVRLALIGASENLQTAAATRLRQILDERIENGRIAPGVIGWLTRSRDSGGNVPLIGKALERPELARDAQAALLVPGAHSPGLARELLLDWLQRAIVADARQVSPETLRGIGHFDDPRIIPILRRALHEPAVAADARTALERASTLDHPEIAAAAQEVLSAGYADGSVIAAATAAPVEEERVAFHYDESHARRYLERVADLIAKGRCTVVIGAGIHAPSPPGRDTFATYTERRLLSSEVAMRIAQWSRYDSREGTAGAPDFRSVMQFAEATRGRLDLAHEMIETIIAAREPSPLLRMLARLPIMTWLTTNYDLMIEQVLRDEGKLPAVVHLPIHEHPYVGVLSPVVVKLHGDVHEPEKLVLTEDDFIKFVDQLAERERTSYIRQMVSDNCLLLLGWNYRSVENRLMLQFLRPQGRDDVYVVYPTPDPLMRNWQEQRALRLIEDDLWSFIPNLFEAVQRRGGIS